MQILVKVSSVDSKRMYVEDVTEELTNYWNDLTADGGNPQLADRFEFWTRSIKTTGLTTDLKSFDNDENLHFIFGWFEAFCQSEETCNWMYDERGLKIEVENIP